MSCANVLANSVGLLIVQERSSKFMLHMYANMLKMNVRTHDDNQLHDNISWLFYTKQRHLRPT